MQWFGRSLAVSLLGAGLAMTNPALLVAAGNAGFQEYGSNWGDIHGLVDRTQTDLRAAADLKTGGQRQHQRYRRGQTDLSTFDRHLSKGHFDKGKLDASIKDVQSILDHNTLQASSRDALLRDVADLRDARARR
jgi:hypothetical protein